MVYIRGTKAARRFLATDHCTDAYLSLQIIFPGHALHEKGLQRQKSDGPLVSSQEQRALFVPRLNQLSIAGFVPASVYTGFRLFLFLERRSSDVSAIP